VGHLHYAAQGSGVSFRGCILRRDRMMQDGIVGENRAWCLTAHCLSSAVEEVKVSVFAENSLKSIREEYLWRVKWDKTCL